MPIFAVLTGQEGSTYLRLTTGEWIKAWPGMTMSIELLPSADVNDPNAMRAEHAVDEKFAAELETELARIHRLGEQEASS